MVKSLIVIVVIVAVVSLYFVLQSEAIRFIERNAENRGFRYGLLLGLKIGRAVEKEHKDE